MNSQPKSARLLVGIALAVGLVIGLGVAVLLAGVGGSGDVEERAAGTAPGSTRDGDPEALAELPDPDPVGDPDVAADPEAAIRGFLAAEAAGEWAVSYDYLTAALREMVYPSAAVWVRAHGDFPRVTAYRIDEVEVDEERGEARVRTLTGFDSAIDPVLGLIPARGRTDWFLEQDDAGLWRVNAAETANQPLYPGSEGVEVTARRWVDARVDCQDAEALEARLIGTRALADRLCEEDQSGEVEIGDVRSLTDGSEATTLISQFGPEVFAWARTVEVDAATPFTLVLGPIGDEWRVVAVLSRA